MQKFQEYQKLNESQIKAALSAARDISAAKNARAASSDFQAKLSRHSQIITNQRTVENLFASSLASAGFDVAQFQKISTQNETELRRIREQQHAEAIKRSSAVRNKLRYQVDSRLKALENLPSSDKYVFLDAPFLIWGTQDIDFPETYVEPANSFAKFKLQDEGEDEKYEEMSFYFLFDNPSDSYITVDVHAYLVAQGFVETWSNACWNPFFCLNVAVVSFAAQLHLLEWWNQPPSEPFPQVDQVYDLGVVLSGSFPLIGSRDNKLINRGMDLSYTSFQIPPHSMMVFEVATHFHYWFIDGGISLDFASGDFELMCPGVLVKILNQGSASGATESGH